MYCLSWVLETLTIWQERLQCNARILIHKEKSIDRKRNELPRYVRRAVADG